MNGPATHQSSLIFRDTQSLVLDWRSDCSLGGGAIRVVGGLWHDWDLSPERDDRRVWQNRTVSEA